MDIFQPVIFGLIQGLTEFLPISSSAHLILLPKFLNWIDPGLAFDVALHFGTLLAVVSYFRKDILEIVSKAWPLERTKQAKGQAFSERGGRYNQNIVKLLIVATIPGAVAGYFLNDLAESVLRSPKLIIFTLVFFGGFLYWADKQSRKKRELNTLKLKDVVLIGCAQALAIIPGTSRSGATITAGLLLGLSRTAAARFSFLMSMPIIFGAVVYKLPDLLEGGIGSYEVVGILASAVSGYLAIAGLMKFINKVSYKIFFWYRIALAILVLVFLVIR